MITLPEDLLREVDATARECQQNCSELVRQALSKWIAHIKQQKFETLLSEGNRETAEQAVKAAEWGLLPQACATDGIWQWDE